MKDEALCRYFINSPDWERQLKQLRKKSLAGYSDGVIHLKDASDAECQAAEGLLGRRFVPPRLRYKLSVFEKALRASRFAVADMADFWQRLDGRPLLSNPLQKAVRQDAVQAFFFFFYAHPHQPVTRNWLCAMAQDKSNGFQPLVHPTLKPTGTRRAGCTGSAVHWIDWQRPLNRKSWRCAAMRFPPIPMHWTDRTPPGICYCMCWLTGKAGLFPRFPGTGWRCTGNVA